MRTYYEKECYATVLKKKAVVPACGRGDGNSLRARRNGKHTKNKVL